MRFPATLDASEAPQLLQRYHFLARRKSLIRFGGRSLTIVDSLELTVGELLEAVERSGGVPLDLRNPKIYDLVSFAAVVGMLYRQLNATAKRRIKGMLRDEAPGRPRIFALQKRD